MLSQTGPLLFAAKKLHIIYLKLLKENLQHLIWMFDLSTALSRTGQFRQGFGMS